LIRIYLHTFENGLSDVKLLVENINGAVLKKQKKWQKQKGQKDTRKVFKSRIFLPKAEEVAGLDLRFIKYSVLEI